MAPNRYSNILLSIFVKINVPRNTEIIASNGIIVKNFILFSLGIFESESLLESSIVVEPINIIHKNKSIDSLILKPAMNNKSKIVKNLSYLILKKAVTIPTTSPIIIKLIQLIIFPPLNSSQQQPFLQHSDFISVMSNSFKISIISTEQHLPFGFSSLHLFPVHAFVISCISLMFFAPFFIALTISLFLTFLQ